MSGRMEFGECIESHLLLGEEPKSKRGAFRLRCERYSSNRAELIAERIKEQVMLPSQWWIRNGDLWFR